MSTASSPRRAAALAPAGVGLALLVAMVQIRMEEPWSDGVLLIVAAAPAILLLALGLAAAPGDAAERAASTALLVAGLVLAGVAIARLGQVLADDDTTSGGGTLTWMLALFTGIAAYCAGRARSAACLLIAALAAVGLLLEAVNWIFDTENVDTFRALLLFAFVVLFVAGQRVSGRSGTVLVAAAGVSVIVSYYAMGLFFVFAPGAGGLAWGWELATLIEGFALVTYAARRLEPGPAYLAFFLLALFAMTAAIGERAALIGVVGDEGATETSHTLVGWPLALAIGTVAAALWGPTRRAWRS
jgi:hypothetical protein